jgi:RNA polymerase sigma factor (sigma-70 family)
MNQALGDSMDSSILQNLVEQLKQYTDGESSLHLSDQELLTRFCIDREETAFAFLVQRHGPMIWGLCQRLVKDYQLAEDIFQATFLVLVRKAQSIRQRPSLASWLYTVAYRIANKVRLKKSRSITEISSEIVMTQTEPIDEASTHELRQILDHAIHQLPEKYRLPVLLCYVQNHTLDQAARELHCPKSSLASRLARARELLQEHLSHRGYAIHSTALISLLSSDSLQSSVSDSLLLNTMQSVIQLHTGQTVQSASALTLADTFLRRTMIIKLTTVCVGIFGFLALGGTLLLTDPKEPIQDNPPKTTEAKPELTKEKKKAKSGLDQYGDPLPKDAIARLGTVRLRHGKEVGAAVFSDDDKTLISSGTDGAIRFWDTKDGKEIRKIETPSALEKMAQLVFGPENKTLVGWAQDGIHVWDITTGKELQYFPHAPSNWAYGQMILSGDRQHAILANQNHDIQLIDLQTGKETFKFQGHQNVIPDLVLSPDGERLASGSWDGTVRIWSIKDRKEIKKFDGFTSVMGLDFSPNGKSLAMVASFNPTVRDPNKSKSLTIRDLESGKEILTSSIGIGRMGSLHFLSDDQFLIVDTIHNIKTGKGEEIFPNCASYVLSPKKNLATGLGSLRRSHIPIWDVKTGKPVLSFNAHSNTPTALILSPDGKRVFSGTWDESLIRIWDSVTGKPLGTWKISEETGQNGPRAFALSPDGKTLAARCERTIRLWDLIAEKEIRAISPAAESYSAFAFTPDSKHLIAMFCAWEVGTGKKVRLSMQEGPRENKAVFVSPDGRTVSFASGSYREVNCLVETFELASGKEVNRISIPTGPLNGLSFHPDGNQLVVLKYAPKNPNAVGEIIDLRTGKSTLTIKLDERNTEFNSPVAFSPNGRTLALTGDTCRIHLLDTATGLARRDPLEGHSGLIEKLVFSADGNRLISGSRDTTGLVWDITGLHGKTITPDTK